MITEIDTLFQLRRDTLENWENSTRVLLPGEAALAYTTVATKGDGDEIIQVPVVLMKAGELNDNSTKTFKELPFVSAIAADVSAWAKKNGLEITFEGEGDIIKSIRWENDTLVCTRTSSIVQNVAHGLKLDKNTLKTNFDFVLDGNTLKLVDIDTKNIVADLDASSFIVDGMLESVTYLPDTHELEFVWKTDSSNPTGKIVKVPLDELIDVYTAGTGLTLTDNIFSHNVYDSVSYGAYQIGRDDLGHVVIGEHLTKDDIDLSNVENKSVAMIKTELTGTVELGDTGFVTGDAIKTQLNEIETKVEDGNKWYYF